MSICDAHCYAAFYAGEYRTLAEWYSVDKENRTWLRTKVSQEIRRCLELEIPFNLKKWSDKLIEYENRKGIAFNGEEWFGRFYWCSDACVRAEIDYWAPKAYLKYIRGLDCSPKDIAISTEENELQNWIYIVSFTKAVLKKEHEIGLGEVWRFAPATAKQKGYLIGLCKQGKLPYGWKRYRDIPYLDKARAMLLIDMATSGQEYEFWPDYGENSDTISSDILYSDAEYYEWRKENYGY